MDLSKRMVVFLLGFAVVLSAAAADPAGKNGERDSVPVLADRSIRIGDKTIALVPDGTLICTNAGNEQIFNAKVFFWAVEDGKPKWGWQTRYLDKKKSRFFRNGKKYFWELWYESPEVAAFQGVYQELEVLPDGRIRFFARLDLPLKRARREFQNLALGFLLPDNVWRGETVEINGESFGLDDEINQTKRAPVTYVFAQNNPSKRFTLTLESTVKSPVPTRLWLYYWQTRQQFHARTIPPKGRRLDRNTALFYLDFRNVPSQSGKQNPSGGAESHK